MPDTTSHDRHRPSLAARCRRARRVGARVLRPRARSECRLSTPCRPPSRRRRYRPWPQGSPHHNCRERCPRWQPKHRRHRSHSPPPHPPTCRAIAGVPQEGQRRWSPFRVVGHRARNSRRRASTQGSPTVRISWIAPRAIRQRTSLTRRSPFRPSSCPPRRRELRRSRGTVGGQRIDGALRGHQRLRIGRVANAGRSGSVPDIEVLAVFDTDKPAPGRPTELAVHATRRVSLRRRVRTPTVVAHRRRVLPRRRCGRIVTIDHASEAVIGTEPCAISS